MAEQRTRRVSTSTPAWSTSCSRPSIRPWPTLYHWDMPQALEEHGGWAHRDIVDRFVDYATTVHDALGDRVDSWTTLNEPWCSSFLSYIGGRSCPGPHGPARRPSRPRTTCCSRTAARSRRCAARHPEHSFGITLNLTMREPGRPVRRGGRRRRTAHRRTVQPGLPRPVVPRRVPRRRAGGPRAVRHPTTSSSEGDLADHQRPARLPRRELLPRGVGQLSRPAPVSFDGGQAPTDRATRSRRSRPPRASTSIRSGLPVTAMGWEVQPRGSDRPARCGCRREYTGPAGIPLYVTENGAAYDDVVEADGVGRRRRARSSSCASHLDAVLDAVDARCRRARLLLLVAVRQLRVGVGIPQAVRDRPGGLRDPGERRQGERARVPGG